MQFNKKSLKLWELELVNKYPLIFLETDADNTSYFQGDSISEDYCNLRFGFECQEGWKSLIEEIAKTGTELVEYLRKNGSTKEEAYIHSCIVKEKMGGLRWQGNLKLKPLFFELWYSYTVKIENQSYDTCEVTGKFGSIRRTKNKVSSWHRTLCEEQAILQGYDLT